MKDIARIVRTATDSLAVTAGLACCLGLANIPSNFWSSCHWCYCLLGVVAGLLIGLRENREARRSARAMIVVMAVFFLLVEYRLFAVNAFDRLDWLLALNSIPVLTLILTQAVDMVTHRGRRAQPVQLPVWRGILRAAACVIACGYFAGAMIATGSLLSGGDGSMIANIASVLLAAGFTCFAGIGTWHLTSPTVPQSASS